MPPLLVVMALPSESAGVFEQAGVHVVYCGVGKVNAAVALTRELSRYKHLGRPLPLVVNFGSVGSRVFDTGTLVACHEFRQRDMDVRALGVDLGVTPFDAVPALLSFAASFPQLRQAVCGSGDSFATEICELPCDVVDMEAYALAKVSWIEHAQFACAKYVTDGADHAASAAWQDNVHRAALDFLHLYRTLES